MKIDLKELVKKVEKEQHRKEEIQTIRQQTSSPKNPVKKLCK